MSSPFPTPTAPPPSRASMPPWAQAAEDRVLAQPLPAGVVALAAEQAVRLLVVTLDVGRRARRAVVVHDEHRVLRRERDRFQRARRSLFDWEDKLYVDGWMTEEVESLLPGLEEEYRDAVRAQVRRTRRRWIATLLPKAGGWAMVGLGHPQLKEGVSKSLEFVAGRFMALPESAGTPMDPETHPGAALHMIRAAYRNEHPEPVGGAS